MMWWTHFFPLNTLCWHVTIIKDFLHHNNVVFPTLQMTFFPTNQLRSNSCCYICWPLIPVTYTLSLLTNRLKLPAAFSLDKGWQQVEEFKKLGMSCCYCQKMRGSGQPRWASTMKKGGVVAFKGVTGSHPCGWGGRQPPGIPPVNNFCAKLAFSESILRTPRRASPPPPQFTSTVLFEGKIQ